jgi:hypothetical protein
MSADPIRDLVEAIVNGLPEHVTPQPYEVCEVTMPDGERCLALNVMVGDTPAQVILRPRQRRYAPRPHGARVWREYHEARA